MVTFNLYRDSIHGFNALGTSRTMAWQLIRNKCHEENIPVPTMDKVILIKKYSESQTKLLRSGIHAKN